MDVELRKYQNILIQTGIGVLAFGVWGVVRTIMLYMFSSSTREEALAMDGISRTTAIVMLVVVCVILFSFDMLIRLYVCMRAIGEAHGRYRGNKYLMISALLSMLTVLGMGGYVYVVIQGQTKHVGDSIITFVVDLTSLLIMGQLIHAALKTRRLRRKLEEVEHAG